MQNRDFRERLKGHKVEPNASSWDQMSQMLDALPKEKEKKKRFFWFYLVGMVGLILGVAGAWYFGVHSDPASQRYSERIGEESPGRSASERSTLMATDTTIGVDSGDSAYETRSSIDTTSGDARLTDIDQITDGSGRNTRNGQDEKVEDNGKAESYQSIDATQGARAKVAGQTPQPSDSPALSADVRMESEGTQDADDANRRSSDQSRFSDQVSVRDGSSTVTGNSIDPYQATVEGRDVDISSEVDASTSESISQEEVSGAIDTESIEGRDVDILPYLSRDLNPIDNTNRRLWEAPTVEIFHPSRFYFVGGLGYAQFNNNHGFILRGGVMYDVDRILDIETSISYAYGSDKAQNVGQEFEYENQVDFNLLFHLNFLKNSRNRLAFVAGIGWTKYKGQRVINVPSEFNFRSSSGRNLSLGIAYDLRLSPDTAIGLRIGAISYDDAVIYIAPSFTKRF